MKGLAPLSCLAFAGLLSCNDGSVSTGGGSVGQTSESTFALEQDLGRFFGDPIPDGAKPFSMLLGDMDLDGDVDYFLNLHLQHPMQVFENTGGQFVQVNPLANDHSGLWENRDVPYLVSDEASMLQRIASFGEPGVYAWHEEERNGAWFFHVVPDPATGDHPSLRIGVNREWQYVSRLDVGEVERVDPFTLDVRLADSSGARTFSVLPLGGTKQLILDTFGAASLYLGTDLVEYPSGAATVWRRDPHGMALVDVVGSSHPELFICHGGSLGNLLPPHDPKVDQLFEYIGRATLYRELDPGRVPAGYGRGRQLTWVDMDGDGAPELFSGHVDTLGYLYDDDGTGTYVDRAVELDLADLPARVSTWIDLDLDGYLDLLYVDGGEFRAALHRAGGFLRTTDEPFGLAFPSDGSVDDPPFSGAFDGTTLHVLDFDRDGRLDLLLTAFDDDSLMRLYLRRDTGFEDVTEGLGAASFGAFRNTLPVDFDNDGWLDLVTTGANVLLWRNMQGAALQRIVLSGDFAERTSADATMGDVDNDGLVDFVLIEELTRQVLFNRSEVPGRELAVDVQRPLGSLIRAYREDGSVQVQQWGFANSSRFNQALHPLRFGVMPGNDVVEIGVQVPGSPVEATRIAVPPGATHVSL